MKEGDLIKSTNNLNNDDLKLLREKFISEYTKKKGWDKNNLTPNQLLEIVEQKEYKNPSLLLS
jgi:hypothetical protein